MNSKHTPGPWRVNAPPSSRFFGVGNGKRAVAARIPVRDDAALIAAAPDLLAALERLTTMVMDMPTDYAQDLILSDARAAIARARGDK